jgi:hypothetical protein
MPNKKLTRIVTPTETLDIEDTRVDALITDKADLVAGKVPVSQLPDFVDDVTLVFDNVLYLNLNEIASTYTSQINTERRFLVGGNNGTTADIVDVYLLPANTSPTNTANYIYQKSIGVFGAFRQELILSNSKLFVLTGGDWGVGLPLVRTPSQYIEFNDFFREIRNASSHYPFDNSHYRISCDSNGFNPLDNNKFLYARNRTVLINGQLYYGSIFEFTNNFGQFEDFVITKNGTFDWVLNRDNTTWSAVNTTLFQPAGSSNWETSQSGLHKITIVVQNPDPTSNNSNRLVIIEKI